MNPTTQPKRTRAFTTTGGERVTKFDDGSETRVSAAPTPAPVQAPITANNVPMSNLATTPQSINMPTPVVPPSDVQGTLSAGRQVAEDFSRVEQERANQAGQKYSASEQKLREQFGVLGTESATRSQLEEQRGVNDFSQDLQTFQQNLRRQMADLDQFDVDNVNTIEQMRVDSSRRDITKRTFNAMSAEAGIQMAVQRANKVASTRATIAAVDVTQGNLTAATEQVDKALKAIYDPVRMGIQMETQFLQNNLSLFNTAQTSAANARIKVMEQEVKEIDRAVELVDAAVMSGYAGAGDIQKMTSLSGNPQEQAAYAQGIVAKGAREMMALERMAKNASISASGIASRKNLVDLAIAGDPQAIAQLEFDPGAPIRAKAEREEGIAKAELDKTLSSAIDQQSDVINRLTKAAGMTNAIKTSTGVMQNAFLSGVLPQKGVNEVAGVGALPGGISGGFDAMRDKAEFLTEMNFLLAGEGFKQFAKLKDQGVNLTPVSELEFNKVMASANMLSSAAETKDGKIVGFGNLAPDVVQREINTMIASAAVIRDEKAAIRSLGQEGYFELLELQNQQ